MKPHLYVDFKQCIEQASYWLKHRSKLVHTQRWQGVDIQDLPEMATHEVANCSFGVDMSRYDRSVHSLGIAMNNMVDDIGPNLPWAEDHFWERVCGFPINPGTQWAKWPYGHSASKFLDETGKFNHNYMERYWPKMAQIPRAGPPIKTVEEYQQYMAIQDPQGRINGHTGIRYAYGDLDDVVNLLETDPLTRQAYLPIWFPEDTGGGSKRAPCTIGYHFLIRDGKININYHIRSCDFLRHFRDDIYLTVRLVQWVRDKLIEADDQFRELKLGNFYMQIGSLHLFRNDFATLFAQ